MASFLPETLFAVLYGENAFFFASCVVLKPIDRVGRNRVKLDFISLGYFAAKRLPTVPVKVKKFVLVAGIDAVRVVPGQVMHFRDTDGFTEINHELSGKTPVAEGVTVKDVFCP